MPHLHIHAHTNLSGAPTHENIGCSTHVITAHARVRAIFLDLLVTVNPKLKCFRGGDSHGCYLLRERPRGWYSCHTPGKLCVPSVTMRAKEVPLNQWLSLICPGMATWNPGWTLSPMTSCPLYCHCSWMPLAMETAEWTCLHSSQSTKTAQLHHMCYSLPQNTVMYYIAMGKHYPSWVYRSQ